ncbi:MAG: hypothetical protein ACJAZ2_000162, partial [Glaciecola sp.]
MINSIANTLSLSKKQVDSVVSLLKEGATIPFIARYRKEATDGLDEVQIGDIKVKFDGFLELEKRKASIIKTIDTQGLLNPEIRDLLNGANDIQALEDLYLPYKQKRKTRASAALELGLEPLAKIIYAQQEKNILDLAKRHVRKHSDEDKPKNTDEVLAGARDIIAEWVNENLKARSNIRTIFQRQAVLASKVKKAKTTEAVKFTDYFDFSEPLKKIPSHRFLAIKRGQEAGFLSMKITIENDSAIKALERIFLHDQGKYKCVEQMKMAIQEAYSRLLYPSVEKEFENLSKEKADSEAINIFSTNLRQLLLSPPLGQKNVLAVDPGIRTGCKTVVLNKFGDLLHDFVIFPLKNEQKSSLIIKNTIIKYEIDAIAIGNGTGGRETESFIKKTLNNYNFTTVPVVHVVSEQGASIYSASEIAREEFPDKDITVRGAVSIGRRLKDPLAELVKIDPKSIGVGQYQHDVNSKSLKESLDQVVISCVNNVGVELNTASKHLLSYVSGLGPVLAKNIVEYRRENGKFTARNQLKKVPRLGRKAYEQAAGFLRIQGAKNPLDNSAVHPETYPVVKQIAEDLKVSVSILMDSPELQKDISLSKYISDSFGLATLKDILAELAKPGRDPREKLE